MDVNSLANLIKDDLRQARLLITRAMTRMNWQDKRYKELNEMAGQIENLITNRKQ
jgi:hypothetical protein